MNRIFLGIVVTAAAVLVVLASLPPLAHTLSAARAPEPQTGIRPPELSAVSRAVFLGGDATPSPDGRLLALFDPAGLSVLTLATGEVRTLVKGFVAGTDGLCRIPPAWSQDSAQLVFAWCFAQTSDGTSFRELRTIRADGTDSRVVLPKTTGALQTFAWSPDGEDIAMAVLRPGEPAWFIGVLSLSRQVLRNLHTTGEGRPPENLAFSPDGRAIAYTQTGGRTRCPCAVSILSVAGNGEHRVLQDPSNNLFVGWTPNGRGILFTSDRAGSTDLWRVHVENGRPTDLPALLLRDVGQWSIERSVTPSGALYYQVGRETAESQSDLYLVSTDPSSGRVLTEPAAVGQSGRPGSKPVWSRDGRHLAFRVNSFPGRAISILSLDRGDERRVEIPASAIAGPRFDWSPDQRFFLFGRTRIDAETGAAIAIPGLGENTRWLPDGRSVMHPKSEPGLYGIAMSDLDADGLTLRTSRWVVDVGQRVLRCYAVSPDASAVAWIAQDNDRVAMLRVTDVTSRATRVLVNLQSPDPIDVCTWAPDGRHVVFSDTTAATTIAGTDYKQSELWRVPATGGRPEKLGLTIDHIVFPAFSPDGRWLAFGSNRHGPGGLFVIENLLPASELR